MSGSELNKSGPLRHTEGAVGGQPQCGPVMITIDESHISHKAIPHGIALANALGADVVLMRVLEPSARNGKLTDPVEWQLLRQQACSQLETLAARWNNETGHLKTQIQEGRPSEQICRWAREHHVSFTVLCSHGGGRASGQEIGRTARCIIECASSSILLVPAMAEEKNSVRYHKIFVPLDGSSRAESALPVALRLAEAQRAEVILVHAVPEPELTEIGPLEAEDIELRARLLRRNELVAQAYLGRIRAPLAGKWVPVQILLLCSGDARHLLVRAVADQKADLVVMASHGHGGHTDVPVGSVAAHMIAQMTVPMLLVRNHAAASRAGDTAIGSPFVPNFQHTARTAA